MHVAVTVTAYLVLVQQAIPKMEHGKQVPTHAARRARPGDGIRLDRVERRLEMRVLRVLEPCVPALPLAAMPVGENALRGRHDWLNALRRNGEGWRKFIIICSNTGFLFISADGGVKRYFCRA